jgi:hypothetical protein
VQLKDSLAAAIARLTAENVPSPRMNAELLLMFTLGCDRAYLFAHPERNLARDEQSRYAAALAERARGVPAQYITGHQEFWGMDLIVSPSVLIPRPETEHLIETVLEFMGQTPGSTEAAERGQNAAHGASRGSANQNDEAPEGRKNIYGGEQSAVSQFYEPTHAQLLTELEITAEVVRSRMDRKPAGSAEITFASKTAWAG